jgi:arylsulfatase A
MKALIALLLVVPLLESQSAEGQDARERPNIVFILTDDLGWYDLGCYGRMEHRTPHLDQLAREGVRFTSAYVAQPICSPSRAALLTGKAPARLHLTTYLPGRADAISQKLLHPEMRMHLPVEERTTAEHLREAGYATGWVGKWHLGGRGFLPTDQGFEFYHPGSANTTASATEGGKGEYDLAGQAMRFMETNRHKPFLLYLSHNNPHIPYSAKAELVEKYKEAFEPVYAALIETLDDSVSLLLRKIDDLGLRERTLVIFTSDNGGLHLPEGGHPRITHNGPLRAGKGFLYEGGLRVPLIARWPGKIPAGQRVDAPVINTDWLPTLLEVAGVPVPAGLDGKSILPVMKGQQEKSERKFFWHFPHYTNQGGQPAGAVREGDWKLIEHYEEGRLELFHLLDDVGEQVNLAAAQAARAAALQSALRAWREGVGAQTNRLNPRFEPGRGADLYREFEPSRFNPAAASATQWERAARWRRAMDAALRDSRVP